MSRIFNLFNQSVSKDKVGRHVSARRSSKRSSRRHSSVLQSAKNFKVLRVHLVPRGTQEHYRDIAYPDQAITADIIDEIAKKQKIECVEYFRLVILDQTGEKESRLLSPAVPVSEVVRVLRALKQPHVPGRWVLRLSFAMFPVDLQSFLVQQPSAFEYLFHQIVQNFLTGGFRKFTEETIIRLGCVYMRSSLLQSMLEEGTHRIKEKTILSLEKEIGFEAFIPKPVVGSYKVKALRKIILAELKYIETLSRTECLMQYIGIMQSEDTDFGSHVFPCSFDDNTAPAILRVHCSRGLEHALLSDYHTTTPLCSLCDVDHLKILGESHETPTVRIDYTSGTQKHSLSLHFKSRFRAEALLVLVEGYMSIISCPHPLSRVPSSPRNRKHRLPKGPLERRASDPTQPHPSKSLSSRHAPLQSAKSQQQQQPQPPPRRTRTAPSSLPPEPSGAPPPLPPLRALTQQQHPMAPVQFEKPSSPMSPSSLESPDEDFVGCVDSSFVSVVNMDQEISRYQLTMQKNLGQGQFGSVDKALWSRPGLPALEVAVKSLKDGAEDDEEPNDERELFVQEALRMKEFDHPHIIKLLGMCLDDPPLIVMEYMALGELRSFLLANTEQLKRTSLTLTYCWQLASAMEYLEKKNFIHRDIAARNVLVHDPELVKLADFGLSRFVEGEYEIKGGKMPIKWMAPESINFRQHTIKSDVWMFGVCCWETLSYGVKPFASVRNAEVVDVLDQGERLPQPEGCPRLMYQMLLKCWDYESKQRPSFEEICTLMLQIIAENPPTSPAIIAGLATYRPVPEAQCLAPTSPPRKPPPPPGSDVPPPRSSSVPPPGEDQPPPLPPPPPRALLANATETNPFHNTSLLTIDSAPPRRNSAHVPRSTSPHHDSDVNPFATSMRPRSFSAGPHNKPNRRKESSPIIANSKTSSSSLPDSTPPTTRRARTRPHSNMVGKTFGSGFLSLASPWSQRSVSDDNSSLTGNSRTFSPSPLTIRVDRTSPSPNPKPVTPPSPRRNTSAFPTDFENKKSPSPKTSPHPMRREHSAPAGLNAMANFPQGLEAVDEMSIERPGSVSSVETFGRSASVGVSSSAQNPDNQQHTPVLDLQTGNGETPTDNISSTDGVTPMLKKVDSEPLVLKLATGKVAAPTKIDKKRLPRKPTLMISLGQQPVTPPPSSPILHSEQSRFQQMSDDQEKKAQVKGKEDSSPSTHKKIINNKTDVTTYDDDVNINKTKTNNSNNENKRTETQCTKTEPEQPPSEEDALKGLPLLRHFLDTLKACQARDTMPVFPEVVFQVCTTTVTLPEPDPPDPKRTTIACVTHDVAEVINKIILFKQLPGNCSPETYLLVLQSLFKAFRALYFSTRKCVDYLTDMRRRDHVRSALIKTFSPLLRILENLESVVLAVQDPSTHDKLFQELKTAAGQLGLACTSLGDAVDKGSSSYGRLRPQAVGQTLLPAMKTAIRELM
eukprot:m.208492 g.208492  ORF g.208492 m.208492 type:complete len:1457 (+) comp26086_c0_seq1:174-4544(+)